MEQFNDDTLPLHVQHFLTQQRKERVDEALRVQEDVATRVEEAFRDTEAGQNYGIYNFFR